MKASEYEKYDALGLGELLRARAVSPKELMACAIELAQARNPAINALCYERYEDSLAIAASETLKGPFSASPFLLKDTAVASKRFPASLGSRLFEDTRFKVDSTVVERFETAGLIPFARTTAPELSMAPTTEAVRNGGPTKNPWDPTRSAGGSSGGAAAAVAAGIVPMAHGSDGGGSIRIPASCCGLYGLKPSRGLVPFGPARGEGWGGLATDGVISRTVRDTAAALDAIAGIDSAAPYAAPPKPHSYLARLELPFKQRLRIAVWSSGWDGISIEPDCLEGLKHASRLLAALGHEVIEAALPDIPYDKFIRALIDVLATNVVVAVNGKVRGSPDSEWERLLEPAILDAYRYGTSLPAEWYALAINRFHSIGRLLQKYITGFDFIMTPTLAKVPAMLGDISTAIDFGSFRRKVAQYTPFLAIINASGQPAANLPLHWTTNDLPIGVQFIAPFGGEDSLLRLSAQLEQVAPWAGRRPSLAVA